jgi:hypothetical protein
LAISRARRVQPDADLGEDVRLAQRHDVLRAGAEGEGDDLLLLGVPAGAAEEVVLVQDGGRDGDALHRDGLHLGGCDGGAGHDQPFFRVA